MKSIFALALAAVAAGETLPPAIFKLPAAQNNTILSVAFRQAATKSVVAVQPGALFGKEITSTQPDVALNLLSSNTLARVFATKPPLLLVMIDPDAPSPDKPELSNILHWLAPGMTTTTAASGLLLGQPVMTNNTANIAPYLPPGPPDTSSAHRYVLYLFEQPAGFTMPAAFSKFDAQNRAGFDLTAFIKAAKLKDPMAVNFFYVSSQAAVPPAFQGAPFSDFPGGNGDAVGLSASKGAGPAPPPAAAPPQPAATPAGAAPPPKAADPPKPAATPEGAALPPKAADPPKPAATPAGAAPPPKAADPPKPAATPAAAAPPKAADPPKPAATPEGAAPPKKVDPLKPAATPAGGSNNTTGAVPAPKPGAAPPAGNNGTGAAKGPVAAKPGQTVVNGTGVIDASGACACSASCPAGSFAAQFATGA